MGIANIINTAGGGGGGGSEIITNLVNSVDGAGLRLANQGYISCADVSANRFGTNDFSVEFVLSQETASVNADIFISNLNGSNQAVDAAVIRWDVVQNDNIQLVFTNSGASETAYNFGYDPAPDLNEPTHYLVSADRSGNAVLYRNGAEIASISIAASGSANVGNSGQPTVIGSPVNNFGVKGNVYRLRTYSKALSSDEAKNVFDRADVPTALVSNLLLDLDCAYANPTQSTVIQDRGPNNQDGTLNGTITQTNVIKQLNSTSARIGTTAATPSDGAIISDNVGIGVAPDVKLAIKDNVDNTNESGIRLLRSANSDCGWINMRGGAFNINTRNNAANAGLPVKVKMHGSEVFTIDDSGNVTVDGGQITIKSDTTNDTPGRLNLWATDTSIVTDDTIGALHGQGSDNAASPPLDGAKIEFNADANWDGGSSNYQPTRIDFFTQNNSGTNTLNSPRLTISSTGAVQIGIDDIQGDALLGVRRNGDAFNFGHVNGAGYGSNIGCGNNNGHPYVAFSCEHGTNDNTFKTRGLLGNVIQANATGELKFSQVTNANADNQTATDRLTINSTGLATFSGDTKIGDGLVANYVKHVAGLDATVAISFTFPSQSSRYIHQMLELRVAMGDDGAATATPTFLRYAFTTLTTASGITQMDASLGAGITASTGASGTTFTVTLTEGSAVAMDSVTVFATVTSGHTDAKCTGMTVA
jgi:hypothetical protein